MEELNEEQLEIVTMKNVGENEILKRGIRKKRSDKALVVCSDVEVTSWPFFHCSFLQQIFAFLLQLLLSLKIDNIFIHYQLYLYKK